MLTWAAVIGGSALVFATPAILMGEANEGFFRAVDRIRDAPAAYRRWQQARYWLEYHNAAAARRRYANDEPTGFGMHENVFRRF